MRYLFILWVIAAVGCNTSSSEKERETDSAKVDGTRQLDTLPPGTDSLPVSGK
ncbi:hypothetical protein [Paracnuella aquatica]|uniref:hypothetical protein n=1 Tax=Paracnuella aquatica TaxID=2268757 RepID=UPI0012D823CF|nr:hypothetical protein [Paracnuella aquatica]